MEKKRRLISPLKPSASKGVAWDIGSTLSIDEKNGLYAWGANYGRKESLLSKIGAAEKKVLYKLWDGITFLGEGVNGKVFGGKNRKTQQEEAIKVVRIPASLMSEFLSEIHVGLEIAQISPAHLVPITAVYWLRFLEDPYSTLFFLSMPKATNTLLDEYENLADLGPAHFFNLVYGIFCGLATLHNAGLVHNDVKPTNILLFGEEAKLADFGLSTIIDPVFGRQTRQLISPSYRPPEYQCHLPHIIQPSADQWSAGVVLLEMVASYIENKTLTFYGGPVYEGKDIPWEEELFQFAKSKKGENKTLWDACFALTEGKNPKGVIGQHKERSPDVGDGLAILNHFVSSEPTLIGQIPQEMRIYLQIASGLLRFNHSTRLTATNVLKMLTQEAQTRKYKIQVQCTYPEKKKLSVQPLKLPWDIFQQIVMHDLLKDSKDTQMKHLEPEQVMNMMIQWNALIKKFAITNEQVKRDLFAYVVLSTWGDQFLYYFFNKYKNMGYTSLAQAMQRISEITSQLYI